MPTLTLLHLPDELLLRIFATTGQGRIPYTAAMLCFISTEDEKKEHDLVSRTRQATRAERVAGLATWLVQRAAHVCQLRIHWHPGAGNAVPLCSLLGASMPRLEALDLFGVGDEEVEHLLCMEAHTRLTALSVTSSATMDGPRRAAKLPWLGALQQLRDLTLASVPLAADCAFVRLTALARLFLAGFPGSLLPTLVQRLALLWQLQRLSIQLSGGGVLDLAAARLGQLTCLVVGGKPNQRIELRGLDTLKALEHALLDTYNPETVTFQAESLTCLAQLTELDLYCCDRLVLPLGLSALTSLCFVDLTACGLEAVPPAVAALPCLHRLRFSQNYLSAGEIPDGPYLSHMTQLELSTCGLRWLPPALARATHTLQDLDLTGNCFEIDADDLELLCRMTALTWLRLQRNPEDPGQCSWEQQSVARLLQLQSRCAWMKVDLEGYGAMAEWLW
eukprot:scaffold3.g6647.t1